MKIKLDENLPALLAELIHKLGHDVQTTLEEGLQGEKDQTIWRAAQTESRFLITQDLDFSDIRKFAPRHSRRSSPRSSACAQFAQPDHRN